VNFYLFCLSTCGCRYNILVYLVTFVLSWIVFALLWWAMQSWHGGQSCVDGVDGFTTALLFSIETQHTIGYGSRAVTDRCSGAVTLLMFQSVFGAVTQCIITGIIFAKVSLARKLGRFCQLLEKNVFFVENRPGKNSFCRRMLFAT